MPGRGARALWHDARWPSRALFLALLGLFVGRAVYPDPHPDRLGFHEIGDAVLAGRVDRSLAINTYPPPFAVAMAPLSALRTVVGDRAVRLLWGGAQLACLLYATLAFTALFGLTPSLGLAALAWLCCWRYVVGDLNSQNVTLFLLALVAAGLASAAAGHERRAGLWLSLGACLEIWPGLALLGLLRHRGKLSWPLLAGAAAGTAGAALVTFAVMGSERSGLALDFWVNRVIPQAGGAELQNQAWKGLALRLGCPVQLAWLVAGSSLAGLLALVVARRPPTPRVRALDAALLLVVGIPCLPLAWYFYYAVLLPIVLAVCGAWPALEGRSRRWALALLVSGTLLGDLVDVDLVGRRAWAAAAALGNTLFGALLVAGAGLVVREAWRRADLAAPLQRQAG